MDINRATQETADRIAIAFARSGIAKKRLAKESGIPYATLDRRFRHGGWTIRESIAVAAVLGVPVTDFFEARHKEDAAA